MIQAEVQTTAAHAAYSVKSLHASRAADKSKSATSKLFEMTFQAVEMDGGNLWREPLEVTVGQLVEAIRLAGLRGKSELNINNITPWIEIGECKTGQVAIVQKQIQKALFAACDKLQHIHPECRLSLFHGQFGIRCYLGRTKPTDFVYEEDFLSDSR